MVALPLPSPKQLGSTNQDFPAKKRFQGLSKDKPFFTWAVPTSTFLSLSIMRHFLLLLVFTSWAWASPCGFTRLMDYWNQPLAARTVVASVTNCKAEALYDSVYIFTTSHFRIYYTLSGPHAVLGATDGSSRPPFIDTLAIALEKAWQNHTVTLGMRPPKPIVQTTHFQRSDHPELYPVEVIELTLLRDTDLIMGGPCEGCYGLTYPADPANPEATQLIIDNDFRYASSSDPSIYVSSAGCSYTEASTDLVSSGTNYHEEWAKALRVTSNHELYHGTQLRYLDFRENNTFWFEASATGVEEVGAPDVNDYWQYLDAVYSSPGTPITATTGTLPYGQATLYLFLRANLGPLFDASIWNAFSNKPTQSFPAQLSQVVKAQALDPEELFHSYATSMFFTGKRSVINPAPLFSEDQSGWPSWKMKPSSTPTELDSASYLYIKRQPSNYPALTEFDGKASLVLWDKDYGTARIYPLTDSLQYASAIADPADSAVLIASTLSSLTRQDENLSAPHAWPNPWDGAEIVCFGPLQTSSPGVELRTADGMFLERIANSGGQACWGRPPRRLAPGVLHWRELPHGKLRPLLVIF